MNEIETNWINWWKIYKPGYVYSKHIKFLEILPFHLCMTEKYAAH